MTADGVLAMEVAIKDASLPIACNLSGSEFQERRNGLLRRVGEAVLEVKELGDGYAYRFPSDSDWLIELANLIALERQCCPFLKFSIQVGPGDGAIWLELSGPASTKEFLNSLFKTAIE
jgi:hypothetical protein